MRAAHRLVQPTQLMEEFLNEWWPSHLGAPPADATSIALMRLVVQVQAPADQTAIRDAFLMLSPSDRQLLGSGERFSRCVRVHSAAHPLRATLVCTMQGPY